MKALIFGEECKMSDEIETYSVVPVKENEHLVSFILGENKSIVFRQDICMGFELSTAHDDYN
jgi:hypothetical protein